MTWGNNLSNWFRGDRADRPDDGAGVGGPQGGPQGPRIYQPPDLPPLPVLPPAGQRRVRPPSVTSRDGLVTGINPGAMPPPGTNPDAVYMLDVNKTSTEEERQAFFDLLKSTMNTQQQILKHCDEMMKKLLSNVSLYRVG
jgi:hypothetical protein